MNLRLSGALFLSLMVAFVILSVVLDGGSNGGAMAKRGGGGGRSGGSRGSGGSRSWGSKIFGGSKSKASSGSSGESETDGREGIGLVA